MTLDRDSSRFLEQTRRLRSLPIEALSPAQARASVRSGAADGPVGPQLMRVFDALVPTSTGEIQAQVFVPADDAAGLVVYMHGGGWVLGSPLQVEAACRILALESNFVVVAPNYRKAPEHAFPQALDDTLATVRWATETFVDAGGRGPLVLAGDSAGGNLATVAARRARDGAAPGVALQVLVYPILDCDLTRPSYQDPANQLMLTARTMEWFFGHYVTPQLRAHPDVSPLRAQDLSGMAPTVLVLAEHDVLRDEGWAYADRLRAAGVDVHVEDVPGVMHGFFPLVDVIPASRRCLSLVATRLRSTVGSP
jgi:acetyl esterase